MPQILWKVSFFLSFPFSSGSASFNTASEKAFFSWLASRKICFNLSSSLWSWKSAFNGFHWSGVDRWCHHNQWIMSTSNPRGYAIAIVSSKEREKLNLGCRLFAPDSLEVSFLLPFFLSPVQLHLTRRKECCVATTYCR